MAQRVLNVDNGPGSNGLRGGIKKYNPKTQTGAWIEEYGGTAGYRRGFTTSDFETEAQNAQYGAVSKPLGYFGGEIPDPTAIEARNTSILGAAKDVEWKSVTNETFQFRGDSNVSFLCCNNIMSSVVDNFNLFLFVTSRLKSSFPFSRRCSEKS